MNMRGKDILDEVRELLQHTPPKQGRIMLDEKKDAAPQDHGLFNKLATAGRDAAAAICEQRGAEYRDSWGECQWLTLRAVLEEATARVFTRESGFVVRLLPLDACRALALAAMVDIKIARFGGGYKADTCDDLVNYIAALRSQMDALAPEDELNVAPNSGSPIQVAGS